MYLRSKKKKSMAETNLPCSISAGTVRSRYIYVAFKGVWGLATNKQNAKWLSLCPACKVYLGFVIAKFGAIVVNKQLSKARQ